jgi:hypothetical protein
MSCLPNVASFSGLSSPYKLCHKKKDEEKQSRETGNIGYTIHKGKTNNPEKLATLGTVSLDCLHLINCVPNVASFSGLFVFPLCLVYAMLPVSLDCLSSPYVLCTQCYQFLWIVCLRLRRRQTIQRNWKHWVDKT